MTQKEKAEAYDKAIALAKNILDSTDDNYVCTYLTKEDIKRMYSRFFPELEENEDEKIRKELLRAFKSLNTIKVWNGIERTDILTWLEKQKAVDILNEEEREFADNVDSYRKEVDAAYQKGYNEGVKATLEKQGEQKITLPKWKYKKDNTPLLRDSIILNKYGCVAKSPSGAVVSNVWIIDYDELAKLPKEEIEKQGEPKFHKGDWITNGDYTWKIVEVKPLDYILQSQDGNIVDDTISHVDEHFHLWYISDAKDGDVFVCNINKAEIGGDVEKLPNITPTICIYQNVVKDHDYIHSYCSLYDGSSLVFRTMYYNTFVYNIHPATKSQRDTLFTKMREAGCEWDAEKKELKKIEQEPIDCNEEYYNEELKSALFTSLRDAREQYLREKNSAWSEEDEETLLKMMFAFKTKVFPSSKECDSFIDFLKSLKDKVQPRQNWSEEDEKIVNCIISDMESLKEQVYCKTWCDEEIDWLKALKDRVHPQPKQEWNKEDEEMFDAIIADIQFTRKAHNDEVNQIVYEREIDWLKSIKNKVITQPKQEWSDEDEKMLYDATGAVSAADYYTYDDKENIVQWLKALKERIGG